MSAFSSALQSVSHLHAVIMAGGTGERLWPVGRRALPKQFLALGADETLLQTAFARCLPLVSPENIWVVTNAAYADETLRQLPELNAANLLREPRGRNTAPCIGWAAERIARVDNAASLVVLPADHLIAPVDVFQQAIQTGLRQLADDPQASVLFGARPDAPVTGFGYIEVAENSNRSGYEACPVAKFHEKPDLETARSYVASGRHLWNCGIFLWRAAHIRQLMRTLQPEVSAGLDRILTATGTPREAAVLEEEFPQLPSVSIDKGVVERTRHVYVVPARFQWADVGTWASLARVLGADEFGNTAIGLHCGIDTSGCVVRTHGKHLVATAGLRDMVVIATPDATLIAPRNDEGAVRAIVSKLHELGYDDVL